MKQGYGMTEAGPVLAMCLAFAKEPFEIKSGSCGTVVRNAEMKIVDPDTGASLPRNKAGEICIRGHQIMKGIFFLQYYLTQSSPCVLISFSLFILYIQLIFVNFFCHLLISIPFYLLKNIVTYK